MNIGALVMDERLQSRTEINETTVAEYAESIKNGDEFPAVLVYFDGINYNLTDGYHRAHAHKRAGKASILCEVVNGTFRDAQLRAAGVNANHGMRRTHADKRKAVMMLLDDLEWGEWSNSEIARRCGVSPTFVAGLRDGGAPDVIKYKTSGGAVAKKAKAAGRAAKEKEPELKEEEKPAAEKPEDSFNPNDELIERLMKDNDDLTMNLALAHMGGTEEQQNEAREIINSLREELRIANIELDAVKKSRDQFQAENAQMKSQIKMLQRQIKKLEG
jgi:ParB-like chromosome segregation protein Spo0J